jgi:hypothetical protein
MRFFVRFPMMQVIFIVIEYKISHFLLQHNFIEDNHWSPIFLVLGNFFAWELFFGSNVPIFLSNKPQTKYFPHGCHEAKQFWPTAK